MFQTNFSFYGLFIILAIICGLVIVYMNLKFLKFKKEETIGLLLYIALGCIFGAKYYTYFVNYQKYNGFFNFIRVGLSSYGAVIGILFMLLLFSKQYRKNFKDLLCILLPAIPFMYAVGKIGCFFAGCCYGIEYDGFLNVTYNYSAIAPKGMSLFPIQLLESIVFLVIFLYTFIKFRKVDIDKNIFIGQTFIICGVPKFFLDYLRSSHVGLFLSTNQIFSITFILAGLILVIKSKMFCYNLWLSKFCQI